MRGPPAWPVVCSVSWTIRRSLGGRACSATRAAPATTMPNPTRSTTSVAAP